MSQGIVIGLDNESRTPTLPTIGGVIAEVNPDNSFIETSDINDINYISEGFLSRYLFKLDKKPVSTGKKLLIALGVVAVLAAAAVATVFTCGAAGVVIGGALAAVSLTASVGAGITVAGAIGIAAGAALAVSATAIGIDSAVLKARQKRDQGKAQAVKGRNEKIPDGYVRKERDGSRELISDISDRYIIKDPTKNSPDAVIVPDYQVNRPYYD